MPIKKNDLKNNTKKLLVAVIILATLLFAVIILFGWYVLDQGSSGQVINNGAEQREQLLDDKEYFLDLSNTDPEVGGILEKVSKHMLLPSKEFSVATVSDASGLQNQSPVLFQYVQDGHKLVSYETGAIVYDPQLDKIVDIIQIYPNREHAIKSQLEALGAEAMEEQVDPVQVN